MIKKKLMYAAALMACVPVSLLVAALIKTAISKPRKFLFKLTDLCTGRNVSLSFEGAAERLARALTFKTISHSEGDPPKSALLGYHEHLRISFPTVFSSEIVTVESINEMSLLLTVQGSMDELQPYLLLSHLDVVPVVEEEWDHPPFAGTIEDGRIIGRGALDVKQTTHAILEALEHRLKSGDFPKRGLYVALGHDEEIGGENGAKEISKVLEERSVEPIFIMDEGTPLAEGFFPGVNVPVAMVGVSEKGYLTMKMTTQGTGGHSSIPPEDTAIGKISHAVACLHPNPQEVLFGRGSEMELLESLASVASFGYSSLYANAWLFGPLLKIFFMQNSQFRALIQTSTAVTIIEGGYKDNVVPSEASAIVNHRISPYQTKEEVISRDKSSIADPSVDFEELKYTAPSPVTPHDHEAGPFSLLAVTTKQVFGENTPVVPSVMVANTDTRHYLNLTKHILRFQAIVLSSTMIKSIHGKNEMVSIENFHNCIRFYYNLMKNVECKNVVDVM